MQNVCEFIHFISLYFTHKHINLCVKYILNAWYSCVQYMNLWMNELHMIFIINSLHVKFVMKFKFEFFSYLHSHTKDSKIVTFQFPKWENPFGSVGNVFESHKTFHVYSPFHALTLVVSPSLWSCQSKLVL
jgi:hypothetical protein